WAKTSWTAAARANHTATLLTNGQVLVAGGAMYDGVNWVKIASAELYDPATGRWTATGAMRSRRSVHTATLLPNGRVLVVGGTDSPTNSELYDPALGSWSLVSGPPDLALGAHTATLLPSGKL